MDTPISVKKLPHHEQLAFCLTRAKYRQGRKLTAVKVYTVNDESKFLILNGIPAIKITNELETLCLKYGDVEYIHKLEEYPQEQFTEAYLVKYVRIKSARFAKAQMDGKNYFGGVLHVCYAPELESVNDTREKLQERRKNIAALTRYSQDATSINPTKKNRSMMHGNSRKYLSRLKPQADIKALPNWSNISASGSTENCLNQIETGNQVNLLTTKMASNFAETQSEAQKKKTMTASDTGLITENFQQTEPSGSSSCTGSQEQELHKSSAQKRPVNSVSTLDNNKKKIKLFQSKKLLSHMQK